MHEECPRAAEATGGGGIDQRARIGRAHLEQHALAELLECLSFECAREVRQRIAPDDRVNADRGAILEDRCEQFSGGFRLIALAAVSEVVLGLSQFAEPVQPLHEQEAGNPFRTDTLLSAFDLLRECGQRIRHARTVDARVGITERCRDFSQVVRMVGIVGRAIDHGEQSGHFHLCRKARHRGRHQCECGFFLLANQQHVRARLHPERRRSRVFDRDRVAEPCDWHADFGFRFQCLREQAIVLDFGGDVALEHQRRRVFAIRAVANVGQ